MATQDYTNGVTLTDAGEFERFDCAAYSVLSGVGGTANAITATGPATYTLDATRPPVWFVAASTNTGATAITITPSGGSALTAKNIFSGGAACVGGEIIAGNIYGIAYDGTQFNLVGSVIRSGAVDLSPGSLTGIKFDATQNASADANTLDDYEEGTWTPVLVGSGNTFSYTTQFGTYTKVGRVVTLTWKIVLNTSGNTLAGNALTMTGAPFAPRNTTGNDIFGVMSGWFALTTAVLGLISYLPANSTTFTLYKFTAATTGSTATALLGTDLHATNGTILGGSMTYEV